MESKIWIVESPGGDFRETTRSHPALGANQVLVKIAASGVNPLDAKIRGGQAPHAQQPLPTVVGLDMSGTVTEIGSAVTTFRVDDEVYGMVGGVGGLQGTLAEFIMPPHFRPAPALLRCEKMILRWPGPFGSGFLSPQPPGVVRIGPVRKKHTPILGQRKLVLFLFGVTLFRLGSRRPVRRRPMSVLQRGQSRNGPVASKVIGLATRKTSPEKQEISVRPISEATYTPRPASGRASRDCRPGHRPPRHRRPRGRHFPAAQSSSRNCRSSRLPSAGYAPHCSR